MEDATFAIHMCMILKDMADKMMINQEFKGYTVYLKALSSREKDIALRSFKTRNDAEEFMLERILSGHKANDYESTYYIKHYD